MNTEILQVKVEKLNNTEKMSVLREGLLILISQSDLSLAAVLTVLEGLPDQVLQRAMADCIGVADPGARNYGTIQAANCPALVPNL